MRSCAYGQLALCVAERGCLLAFVCKSYFDLIQISKTSRARKCLYTPLRFSSLRREQRYSTLCFLYKSDTEGEINKCYSTILSFQFKSNTEMRVEISVSAPYD